MISRTAAACQTPNWHRDLAQAIVDPEELIEQLRLPPDLLPAARAAAARFGLRVPRYFAALMRPGDAHDPLLRQVLPIGEELLRSRGFSDDPVGDREAALGGGVLSKYRGRALLIASAACAVNCRYCFRRAFPYSGHLASRNDWRDSIHLLRRDTSIREAILSGGDPLTLDDAKLADLIRRLDAIPHLKRLRIHTRLPVVLPHRVTDELVRILGASRLRVVTVLHYNHPNELPPQSADAIQPLKSVATLLNQSVLLKAINDTPEVLIELSERLFDSGILPYYIHLLDRVNGAAHFEVDEATARRLIDQTRAELPGYLIPRLVKEEQGKSGKTLIS